MLTVLLVALILVALGAFPAWPHASGWGYGPSGLALVLVIVLAIYLFGHR